MNIGNLKNKNTPAPSGFHCIFTSLLVACLSLTVPAGRAAQQKNGNLSPAAASPRASALSGNPSALAAAPRTDSSNLNLHQSAQPGITPPRDTAFQVQQQPRGIPVADRSILLLELQQLEDPFYFGGDLVNKALVNRIATGTVVSWGGIPESPETPNSFRDGELWFVLLAGAELQYFHLADYLPPNAVVAYGSYTGEREKPGAGSRKRRQTLS